MRWENTAEIKATADVVWRLTLDVAAWPSITPTVTRVDRLDQGPLRVGSRARIKQPRQAPAIWTVTHLDDGREFTWQTRRLGLTMIGSHRLERTGQGCRNTLTLDVQGRGSVLFGRIFGRVLSSSLATENAGFQSAAETGRTASVHPAPEPPG
jgi:hypothetical protein